VRGKSAPHTAGIREVVERRATHGDVEFAVGVRQFGCVTGLEPHVHVATALRVPARDVDQRDQSRVCAIVLRLCGVA
jgi:hypothetical protein